MLTDIKSLVENLGLHVSKEPNDDGSYDIISISTVDRADKEGETFTKECIDYDANLATKTGNYPEYRMFHKRGLGIGKVTKMSRIGDYAIEEGKSYTDPFSLAVCKDLLANNDGTWKNSRGFYVHEASGGCPNCSTVLKVNFKHMVAGFYCPVCKSLQTDFRGELSNTRFLKARTFDITITDHPAVPWTATIAYTKGEVGMTKTQLKKKMLLAGIEESVIDARLKEIDGEVLKELGNDLPYAEVLKEVGLEEVEGEETEEEVEKEEFVMDDGTIDAIAVRVASKIAPKLKEMLAGASFEVDGLDELAVEMKEVDTLTDEIASLKDEVVALKELVEQLVSTDDKRLAKKLKETPRNGKLRIIRRVKEDPEEDMEDEDEEDEDEEDMPVGKKQHRNPAFRTFGEQTAVPRREVIVDGQGHQFKSMTEMVTG